MGKTRFERFVRFERFLRFVRFERFMKFKRFNEFKRLGGFGLPMLVFSPIIKEDGVAGLKRCAGLMV